MTPRGCHPSVEQGTGWPKGKEAEVFVGHSKHGKKTQLYVFHEVRRN